jgi:hypothetical protein
MMNNPNLSDRSKLLKHPLKLELALTRQRAMSLLLSINLGEYPMSE